MNSYDLIGQTVRKVYSSFTLVDGCEVQEIILELSDGRFVTIPDEDNNPKEVNVLTQNMSSSQFSECENSKILKVLSSEYLPCYSLLFDNMKILFGDSGAPSYFHWYLTNYSDSLKNENEFKEIQR